MADWYVGSVQFAALTAWAATTAYVVGDIRKNTTGVTDLQRVWRCTTAGTSGGTIPTTMNNGSVAPGGTVADNTAVWTDITGNATYNWAAPYSDLPIAITVARVTAGDRIFVSDNHASTRTTSFTWVSAGTLAAPLLVFCVDRTGSIPPVSADLRTTAVVSQTTNAGQQFVSGVTYMYGITIECSGSGITANTSLNFSVSADSTINFWTFESCALKCTSTNTAVRMIFGAGLIFPRRGCMEKVVLTNTKLSFNNASQSAVIGGIELIWRGTPSSALITGVLPTTLFTAAAAQGGRSVVTLDGVDFSQLTANTLFGAINGEVYATVQNCKLDAGTTISATQVFPNSRIDLICSDSSGSHDRQERHTYTGDLTREATIIRTGGASDGVAGMSWKIITTANTERTIPFETFPMANFVDTIGGAVTATVEIVNDGVTFKNDEVWVEFYTLDSSGNPLAAFHSTRVADLLAAGTNIATSSATWAGTGGFGAPVKQKIETTFTPQLKGVVRARLCVARASTTLYVCPKLQVA